MMGSLFDSSLDFVASLLNLLAVKQAIMPPDAEHRFGHGKAEAIAGMGQGAIIAGSATFLLIESVEKLVSPHKVQNAGFSIAIIVVSMVLTAALVFFQQRVVKKTGSLAIAADQLHYAGDLLMNAVVISAVLLSGYFGWIYADGIGGLFVAAIIGYSAAQIMRSSFDHLMDREFADDDRSRIKAVVQRHPDVRAIHDLRTRSSGSASFIQFHIELDPAITLMRAHAISDEVEDEVRQAFPDADVIIHQDPAGLEDPPRFAKRNGDVRGRAAS